MIDSHYVTVGSGSKTVVQLARNVSDVEIVSLDGADIVYALVDPADGDAEWFDDIASAGSPDGSMPLPAAPCSRKAKSISKASTTVWLLSKSADVECCVLNDRAVTYVPPVEM